MPRADLLLDLARAGTGGDRLLFRKALEAIIADERAKQHHILADRLASPTDPQSLRSRLRARTARRASGSSKSPPSGVSATSCFQRLSWKLPES